MKFLLGIFTGVLTLIICVAGVVAVFIGGFIAGYKTRESEDSPDAIEEPET